MTILGIDPKNDYAFKCVFGSEKHTRVLIHLLNAGLKPLPGHRVETVQILNPVIEPAVLDEKLAILDVRARDQSGRLFDVEMQMVVSAILPARFLYYWAGLFSDQLKGSEKFNALRPAICFFFVDGRLFPQTDRYHLRFRVFDPAAQITFSDQLDIHAFQLPNFTKGLDELTDPLDKWLYFLNNGKNLDPNQLPVTLQESEIMEAVNTLAMLTQDELERERIRTRENAIRNAHTMEALVEEAQQNLARARQDLERAQEEARVKQAEGHAEGRTEGRAEGYIEGEAKVLSEQLRFLEALLKRPTSPEEQLRSLSLEQLRDRVTQLQQEVLAR